MSTPVTQAGLSTRTVNALTRGGYITMDDVLAAGQYELLRLPEFGRKSLNEIEAYAREQGKLAGGERDAAFRLLRAAEERLAILQRDIAILKRQLGIEQD